VLATDNEKRLTSGLAPIAIRESRALRAGELGSGTVNDWGCGRRQHDGKSSTGYGRLHTPRMAQSPLSRVLTPVTLFVLCWSYNLLSKLNVSDKLWESHEALR
jgi:hypothetical protein